MLLARRQHGIQVFAVATALLLVFATEHTVWSLPVVILGALIGGFPFRRTLYSESWNVADYVGFALASIVGTAGFWLLLGFTPALIIAIARGWIASQPLTAAVVLGILFGAALLAWERWYTNGWLAMHRATPLARPDLQPALDDIIRRSKVRHPGIYRYGARGSYAMNAFALPSRRTPGVAFGDTLLDMLAPDEIAAIFAHEVAHLEQYEGRMLRRLQLMTYALVLGAIALPAILLMLIPEHAGVIAFAWPVIVLLMLLRRVSKSQAHESESDRRSAELVGDPEPMVRALTKLHHYSRLPRRWPYDFERSASHPSLARRIQALRADHGAATPSLAAPIVLRTTIAGYFIALDATRIYMFEGVPENVAASESSGAPSLAVLREQAASYRAVAYSDLTELRVGVSGVGRALCVRDRAGKKWSIPLRADDIATVQTALDSLDGQLATRVRTDWKKNARIVAAILILALVGLSDFGWTWIPLLVTLAVPSAWSVAALGTMVIGRTALTAAGNIEGPFAPYIWIVAAYALACGVWSCALAWQWATSDAPHRQRRVSLAGAAAIAGLLVVGAQGLAARASRLEWTTGGSVEQVATVRVDGIGYGVSLSPNGRRLAIQTIDSADSDRASYEDLVTWRYTIADSGGAIRTIDAYDLVFADDDRVLGILPSPSSNDSMVVAIESAIGDSSGGTAAWRRTFALLREPTIHIDRPAGRWVVFGSEGESGIVAMITGSFASDSIAIRRISYGDLIGSPIHVFSDGTALVSRVNAAGNRWLTLSSLGIAPMKWDLWRVSGSASDRLGALPGYPDCDRPTSGPTLLCVVYRRSTRSLWRIDDQRRLTEVGVLPRQYDLWGAADSTRIVAGSRVSGELALIDADHRTATRLVEATDEPRTAYLTEATVAAGRLAVLTTSDGRSVVRLYRVR
jgi:Zn-dependent protease with chaperone function